MKTSRYNYIIKRNNDSYWYNGVEHTFFKLPLELGSKIENLLASSETIQYIPDTFISKLEDTGFLISDNVDELEVIRKKNDERIHRKDYTLTILPTLKL